VAVRLEQQQDGTAKLYFITLGVLAPYRGCGIGGCMAKLLLPSHIANVQGLLGIDAGIWHATWYMTYAPAGKAQAVANFTPSAMHQNAWLMTNAITS